MGGYTRRFLLGSTAKGLLGAPLAVSLFRSGQVLGATSALGELPQPHSATGGAPAIKLPPFKSRFDQEPGPEAQPLPPAQRVGFAVVGLGNLTVTQILPAIVQTRMAKLTALVSGHPEKARALASSYGVPDSGLYTYDTFADIARNPDVHVVYIVLPNGLHKEYTLRAAAAGKDVLCEKPMANNSAEAQAMTEACAKAGRKLMIAYRQQYEPYNDIVRQMVRSEYYGKPQFFQAVNVQVNGKEDQWRYKKSLAGGGSLPDVGLYCLNACRFLTGQEPLEVMARIFSTPNDPRFREVEETVDWQMRFPSGLMASCTSSYGMHEDRRYRIYGERGWVGLEPAFAYGGLQMQSASAQGAIELAARPKIVEVNQFAQEMDHMAACVLHNRKPHTGGEEGVQDHKIMEAIYASAASGKVVELPRITQLDATRSAAAFG